MFRKFIADFSILDLMIIALMAALGIAVKAVIVPLVHIITGPLYIPGGVVAGGVYMMFIVMAAAITGKKGTGTLTAFVQAIMVIVTGMSSSHGVMSIVTYTLPGFAVDLIMIISKNKSFSMIACFFAGMAANITGSFSVNFVFFNMPFVPLMISILAAALSGGLGGILAYHVAGQLARLGVISKNEE